MDWGCTGLIHCVIMQHGSHSQSSRSRWQLITSKNASPFKTEILFQTADIVSQRRYLEPPAKKNPPKNRGTSARGCETPWNLKHSHLIATTTRRLEFATSCRGSECVRNVRSNGKRGAVAAPRECHVVCKPTQVSQQITVRGLKLCFLFTTEKVN